MLDREVDDSAADLHGLVEAGQKWRSLLHQNQSTKLALVIFKQELSSLELDFRVASRDGDVIDSQIALVASSKLEDCLAGTGPNYVDNSGVILLLRKTLQHHEVALRLLILHQVISVPLGFHHERISGLTDLALESLPEVGAEVGRDLRLLTGL